MYDKFINFWKSFQGCLGDNEILIKEGNNSAILNGQQLICLNKSENTLFVINEK